MGRSSIYVAFFLSVRYARLMSQGYRFGCEAFSSLLSSYSASASVSRVHDWASLGSWNPSRKCCLSLKRSSKNPSSNAALDYFGFNRNSDKVEEAQITKTKDETRVRKRMRMRKSRFIYLYPWKRMWRVTRGDEEKPYNLLPLQEAPIGKNYQSIKIHKPFYFPEVQKLKRDLGDCLEDP